MTASNGSLYYYPHHWVNDTLMAVYIIHPHHCANDTLIIGPISTLMALYYYPHQAGQ